MAEEFDISAILDKAQGTLDITDELSRADPSFDRINETIATPSVDAIINSEEFQLLTDEDKIAELSINDPRIKKFDFIHQRELINRITPEAINQRAIQKLKDVSGAIGSAALDPLEQTGINILQDAKEGFDTMIEAITQPSEQLQQEAQAAGVDITSLDPLTTAADKFRNIPKFLGGLLQNAISPFTGPGTFVGDKAEEFGELFSREIGQKLPLDVQAAIYSIFGDPQTFGQQAKFTTELLIPTQGVRTIGKKVLGLEVAPIADILTTSRKVRQIAEETQDVKVLEDQVADATGKAPGLQAIKPGFVRVVDTPTIDDITVAAKTYLEGNTDEGKRLFENITDGLRMEQIDIEALPRILKRHNLSPVEFAAEFKGAISKGARDLNKLSQLKKQMKKVFGDDPKIAAAFDEIIKNAAQDTDGPFRRFFLGLENKRRALLVSQLATAMRNLHSQAGRISLSQLDETLQTFIKRKFVGEGEQLNQVHNNINVLTTLLKRMNPRQRIQLERILNSEEATVFKTRLFSQPVHEVTIGDKFASFVNTINRTQEFFFRKLAFEAKMRQKLSEIGLNFETVTPKQVPIRIYEESLGYALEMTFAASPKGKANAEFIRVLSQPPFTLINPFPRFQFGNMLPFLIEHSPLGYGKMLGKESMKALASGDPSKFAKAASRATIGTIMMDLAIRFRGDPDVAGDEWYQIKAGTTEDGSDKIVDIRPFAPFSTYMLFAEHFSGKSKLTAADYTEVLIGLNRVSGSGLMLTDVIRGKKLEDGVETLQLFAAQYLASFATPFRTLKDLSTAVDPEADIRRDMRQNKFFAPLLNSLPGASKLLPQFKSPFDTAVQRTEPLGTLPGPFARQFLGLSTRRVPPVLKELNFIDFDIAKAFPRTGVPAADNKIAGFMAPITERVLKATKNNQQYGALSNVGKRLFWELAFGEIKAEAGKQLALDDPGLAIRVALEGATGETVKEFIKEETGLDIEAIIKGKESFLKIPETISNR